MNKKEKQAQEKAQEFHKLKWQLFWKYKTFEGLGVLAFIFVPYFLGFTSLATKLCLWLGFDGCVNLSFIETWEWGFILSIIIGLIIFVLWYIIYQNLEWAQEKAEEKVYGYRRNSI